MNQIEFIKTIYLGDRVINSVIFDGEKNQIKIQIDLISRIRGNQWNYYDKEDIINGYLVFLDVENFVLEPTGRIPNGHLEIHKVHHDPEKNLYTTIIATESFRNNEEGVHVDFMICARKIILEDKDGNHIED